MVHLDRVQGQKGHMIIHEDGTIISSSGELASNEPISQHVTALMAHSLPVNFNANPQQGKSNVVNGSAEPGRFTQPNGSRGQGQQPPGQAKPLKWNRVTVSFAEQSYMACLSNRRIHVIKRENQLTAGTPSH